MSKETDQHRRAVRRARRPGPSGYCYRLLGSSGDTDDAVQETLIRASSRLDQYDPSRGRLSTWVHGIATNVCIDMLRSAKRRALVVNLDESVVPGEGLGTPFPPDRWLEPMPDARLIAARDPAEVMLERESVRLAFLVALQCLAPRQRAVLVLRDVLAFTAQETAQILGTTVVSVNSALQRARASLADRRSDPSGIADPEGAGQRDLLRRYVTAFEAHDIAGLTAILREDAVASMPPFGWRLTGAEAIAATMGASESCAGARLIPCRMNGAQGFGQYRPGDDSVLCPFALVAVQIRDGVMAGTVRAGFSFNKYADRDARSAAREKSGPELVDLLRRNIGNPWQPPGGGAAGALSHDVIHGLDATEPLGLPAPSADRIALVLGSVGPRQLRYFGVDLGGRRLTATDADVSLGDGANVTPMTAKGILLLVTGRQP